MQKAEMIDLLKLPLIELVSLANKVREDSVGSNLELCSIINAKSGLCSEDCRFCAQSARHNCAIDTYPLRKKSEIIEAAKRAKETGAKKFGIVTSGNRLNDKELNTLIRTVSEIKNKIGIEVCGSLGALEKNELARLRQAGLSRYHHNIETSENFYPQIVSTHSFEQRVNTIKAAKEVGLEVCSGGIIGLGESWGDRIDMALLLKELNVDSVPINLLIPVKGTAFENLRPISCLEAVKTICIFRIILKDKAIKIAAGRETVLKDFQAMGFMAGANGMLIGGYLTVKGRDVEQDYRLVEEIGKIWAE